MKTLEYKNISKETKRKFINFCLLFFNDYYKIQFGNNGFLYFYERSWLCFNKRIKINFYKLLYEVFPREISERKWKSLDLVDFIIPKISSIIRNEYATDDQKMKDLLFYLYSESEKSIIVDLYSHRFNSEKFLYPPTKMLKSKRMEKKKKEDERQVNEEIKQTVLTVSHNVIDNSSIIKRKTIVRNLGTSVAASLLFLTLNLTNVKIELLKTCRQVPYIHIANYCNSMQNMILFDSS